MKKWLIFVLAVSIFMTLPACKNTTEDETTEEIFLTDATSAQENGTTASLGESQEFSSNATVLADNEFFSIILTRIDSDVLYGYTLGVTMENKSPDVNYTFTIDSASINGVAFNPPLVADVAAGKKANDEIIFYDEAADEALIGEFSDIELTFRVYDSDDWSADDIWVQTVHIYPLGEENVTLFVRGTQPEDQVLIDNDDLNVTVTACEWDTGWGYIAKLFIVNKTDKNLMISADDVSINGYMIDPMFAAIVPAGKSSFQDMTWFSTSLQDNGITEVGQIEFSLRVYDYNDWMADDIANETFILNP